MAKSPDTNNGRSGTESVWDYPRPPRLEPVPERLKVIFAGEIIGDTTRGMRVLETSHPPVYYFPVEDIRPDALHVTDGTSFCEYKGVAKYVTLRVGNRESANAGWTYPKPTPAFSPIAGFVAFYASRVDEAWVGDEKVQAQQGDFYGGWITSRIVGPFKGGPGTSGW